MSDAPLAMLTRRLGTIIAVRSDRCAACDLVDLCGPEYACPPFRAAGCYRGITQLRAGKGGVMKACLTRIEARIYWIDDEGQEREGAPGRVSGDLSGVYGNLSGVYGDIDDAGITDDEREAGISIDDLIRDDAAEAAKE